MASGTLIAVCLYFLLMLGIGLWAWRRSAGDNAGYLLGGRQLGPAVTALSAGASDMSAWILMGLPGAMVVSGLDAGWIALGLLIGAWANYRLVAPRLRIYTEQLGDALTLPDFFEKRVADRSRALRVVSSLVIVVFFTLYTSAGLVAGGLLFETSFGLSYGQGIVITAAVVAAYTLLGGFRAVCTTDFVQGSLMLLALLVVPAVTLSRLGGFGEAVRLVDDAFPGHLDPFAGMGALALLSSLAWGLGYFGQPHIIVRFMAIRSVAELGAARRIGIGWMLLSLLGALLTGFAGLAWVLASGQSLDDPEAVFIVLSQLLFHPLIGGVLLAAILAAVMSTISSQLLVSSSSLGEDFYKVFLRPRASQRELVLVSRLAVLAVALLALLLAARRDDSILSLVSNAWAGFGAAFGPLVLMSLFWNGMNRQGALAGMVTGALVVLLWIHLPLTIGGAALSSLLYEIVPGFLCSLLAIVVVSRLYGDAGEAVRVEFAGMRRTNQLGP